MTQPSSLNSTPLYGETSEPVERRPVDKGAINNAVKQILLAIGEDPTREGVLDTPRRVADFWAEFIDYDPGRTGTVFESASHDQMVVVKDMRVWSLCEHHLLPFWCDISIGYIAAGKVLGLSKFARIAKKCAHRLNLQEGLVTNIAAELKAVLGTENVAVLAKGEHLCMTMRGVETPHRMISSSLGGEFMSGSVRAEFLKLIE